MTITQTQDMRSPLAFSGAFKPSLYPPEEGNLHLMRIIQPTLRVKQLNGFSKFKRLTFHRNLKGFV